MNTEKPGMWGELLAVLLAALVAGCLVAYVVSEEIWRHRMNEIVKQRTEKGEKFIYDDTEMKQVAKPR